MGPDPVRWGGWRKVLFLIVFLSVPCVMLASTRGRNKGGGDFDLSGIVHPDLVNAPSDPTLRFPVMRTGGSFFSITYGWLDLSNSTIRYTVVQPTNKSSHSFTVSRLGVTDIRVASGFVTFRSDKRREMFTYLPQDRWGTVHTRPGMDAAANREGLGSISIYKTLLNFDRVMAMVNPPAPPPVVIQQPVAPQPEPKAAPPSPPAIVLSSPAGLGDNQTLDWQESTVVLRGVAMDSTGIPVVRINGSPANMRPQTPQAAEFWSDPLTLQEGTNTIQIDAANSAQVEAKMVVTINYKPKTVAEKPKPAAINPRALDRLDIIGLLQGGVAPERLIDLVKDRGIKFSPSADDLAEIRNAGGTDDLIQAIQQAAPQP